MKYGYYLLDIFSLGLEIPNVFVGESRPELCYILAFCKIQRRIKPAYTEDCFVSKIQVGDGKGTNKEYVDILYRKLPLYQINSFKHVILCQMCQNSIENIEVLQEDDIRLINRVSFVLSHCPNYLSVHLLIIFLVSSNKY